MPPKPTATMKANPIPSCTVFHRPRPRVHLTHPASGAPDQSQSFPPGLSVEPAGVDEDGNSLFGGSMRKKYFASYANYFVKFLQAYADAGSPSMQSPRRTKWTPTRMGECLLASGDRNTRSSSCRSTWDRRLRAIIFDEDLDPRPQLQPVGPALGDWKTPREEIRGWNCVARYAGSAIAMTRVQEAYPDKHMYWTEGGPDYTEPGYGTTGLSGR